MIKDHHNLLYDIKQIDEYGFQEKVYDTDEVFQRLR